MPTMIIARRWRSQIGLACTCWRFHHVCRLFFVPHRLLSTFLSLCHSDLTQYRGAPPRSHGTYPRAPPPKHAVHSLPNLPPAVQHACMQFIYRYSVEGSIRRFCFEWTQLAVSTRMNKGKHKYEYTIIMSAAASRT